MIRLRFYQLAAICALSTTITACGESNSPMPNPNSQTQARAVTPESSSPLNTAAPLNATLKFSTGILTIAGSNGTTIASGLNVVSTFRHGGSSASAVSTPTIKGPFDFSTFTMARKNAGIAGAGPEGDSYTTAFGSAQPNSPSGVFFGAPSVFDKSRKEISSTPWSLPLGSPACDSTAQAVPAPYVSCGGALLTPSDTTFGHSGGVFLNGLQPGNANVNSRPYSFAPYVLPLFATTRSPRVTPFEPYGGPPAFDPSNDGLGFRDGHHSSLTLGAITGMSAMELPQNAATLTGKYTLRVVVPTGTKSTIAYGPVTATANAAKALPAIAAPALTLDGKGGATVTVPAFSAGVTEEYVYIIDNGPAPESANTTADSNCQGSLGTSEAPVYYTLVFTAPGTYAAPASAPTGGVENVGLPDTIGPNVNTSVTAITGSPSICTAAQNSKATGVSTPGDRYTVIGVGIDYDLYDAMAPRNTSQNPRIVGAAGQDDMTISAPLTEVSP